MSQSLKQAAAEAFAKLLNYKLNPHNLSVDAERTDGRVQLPKAVVFVDQKENIAQGGAIANLTMRVEIRSHADDAQAGTEPMGVQDNWVAQMESALQWIRNAGAFQYENVTVLGRIFLGDAFDDELTADDEIDPDASERIDTIRFRAGVKLRDTANDQQTVMRLS